jgi:hypothetical protein
MPGASPRRATARQRLLIGGVNAFNSDVTEV